MTAAAKIAEARALPVRICIWDCKTLDDGEVQPRGWTTSYPPRHPDEYVRADLADALAQENAKLRAGLAGLAGGVSELETALIEALAELMYLRKYGRDGGRWEANESKDVWRDIARSALGDTP